MTNADKLLKDGVTIEDFEYIYHNWLIKDMILEPEREMQLNKLDSVMRFLRTPCKPILTEDERVILRNIKNDYDTIERTSFGSLKIVKSKNGYTDFYEFNHLFQFIENREEYEIKELLEEKYVTN